MATQAERITALEVEMKATMEGLKSANDKLDTIVTTLAQMSGGKKAMLGLFALLGAVPSIIMVIINLSRKG